ncbi:oxygenase [Bordetella ansorpii]|uniref:Oxygenase n=1 Tax=Bordetella ansorpii TaxID=288768 RepID=A0A157STJ8_9BORD|nr:FAD-dependent monooxygenase [Bordetella ansorpii]SAI73808.1 oxygenase [Bordetella ansorpii]
MHDSISHDVIIAGAGPVGLFLACELRLAGVSVLVLERAGNPDTPLKRLPFGMRGLSVATQQALDRRGLLADVAACRPGQASAPQDRAPLPPWMRQPRLLAGHFAGIPIHRDQVDPSRWPYRLPDAEAGMLVSDIAHIEQVLAARAVTMGAEIRRGAGVSAVAQTEDHVTVQAGGQAFHARWLVGCDGGRSMVRKSAGFTFEGTDPEFTGYCADIALADPDALAPGRHHTPTGMYTYQRPGFVTLVDFDGGAFHRSGPLTREHVQSVLRRVSGVDVELVALGLATTWSDRAFQATAYRQGRVLLAGDAAHTHSPLGGQGLNLGLGDAMNLGWKLAATIHGAAPPGLLDSYPSERMPIGARILDWSRAQVALLRPGASSRALGAILRDLIETRDGATYFAQRLWGVSLRYELADAHPLVGRSAPDFVLADGTRLATHLRHGKGLLLDFSVRAPLADMARRWDGRIGYVCGEAADTWGLSAALVRPDGIVAWAGEGEPDQTAASAAIENGFGLP